MVNHPTHQCFVLNEKNHALVNDGVLTLKLEQKKVTANMVTLKFGTMPKITVPDGSFPIPKARLEINDPLAKQQKTKGFVPLTLKTGKIMWMHPDLAQDKQWISKKSKSKGRSCNVVSVLPDDDNVMIASLSDSKNERHAFTVQADVP